MVETRLHSIPVGDATLRVLDSGPAGHRCIVLTHSIMASAAMWEPQVPFLVAKGWRVLRPDSRGHGGSTLGSDGITIDRLASDVVAILDRLGLQRVQYAGLSLGGMVGFGLMKGAAHRFEGLVICDARADSPPEFAQPWDARIGQALSEGMQALVEPTLQRWFGARLPAVDEMSLQSLSASMLETPVEGFVATARALQAFDYTDALAGADIPTTLIVGEHDGVLPAVMADLAARIPGARLEIISHAGHLPNVEQPESFNNALMRHLEDGR